MKENQNIENFIKNFRKKGIFIYITVIITVIAFVLRGIWYFNQLGYFYALHIDISYLKIDNEIFLYSELRFIVIAMILFISNFIFYQIFLQKKNLWLLLKIYLSEVLIFWIIVCSMSAIDIANDIIKHKNGIAYLILFIIVAVFVAMMNILGIVFGLFIKKVELGEGDSPLLTLKNEIKKIILILPALIALLAALSFVYGSNRGNRKTDFKFVMEKINDMDSEILSENYIFTDNEKNKSFFYAILYENENNYLLAYMYNADGRICIDKNKQKVISKKNVSTFYGDIEQLNRSIADINQSENIKNEQWNNEIIKYLASGIIGLLVGLVLSFLIFKHYSKKKKNGLQSYLASILYNDLESIAKHLKEEKSFANFKYSDKWEDILENYLLLDNKSMGYIYRIYNETFRVTIFSSQKISHKKNSKKKMQNAYKKLKELIFCLPNNSNIENIYNEEYVKIVKELKEKVSNKI